LNRDSPLAALATAPMRPGRVVWIGQRPARLEAVRAVTVVQLVAGAGMVGDHYAGRSGTRQVTLIETEDLAAIAAYLGRDRIGPEVLRRNIVVSGVNLRALKGRPFRVGGALLDWIGECHPCSRMEAALGVGGYNAVRGHGGITARVLEGGGVRLGDAVSG
jgi:MOSC domain-containing protein YiiM